MYCILYDVLYRNNKERDSNIVFLIVQLYA